MNARMNAREAILNSVRSALKRGPLDDTQRAVLDARVPQHTRPAQKEDLVARFVRKFESRAGTVERVAVGPAFTPGFPVREIRAEPRSRGFPEPA